MRDPIRHSTWHFPAVIFVVAALFAVALGPVPLSAMIRGQAQMTGACTHTAGIKETPFLCTGMETAPGGGGILVPIAGCDSEAEAPAIEGPAVHFFQQIHGPDALAARTLRVLRAAKDGDALHGVLEQAQNIKLKLVRTSSEKCDPCHDITSAAVARCVVNVWLTMPDVNGDASAGSGTADATAKRRADCKKLKPGSKTTQVRVDYFRQRSPEGITETFWEQDINGNIKTANRPLGAGDPDKGVALKVLGLPDGDGFEPVALDQKATLKYAADVKANTTRAALQAQGGPSTIARTRSTIQLLLAELSCKCAGNRLEIFSE